MSEIATPGGCEETQPLGYFCSRDFHHTGPCALHPNMNLGHPVYAGGWSDKKIENFPKQPESEKSGGPTSYYLVKVDKPNQAKMPYQAECGDIIEALGMNFNEGCAFKALWRTAAARTLGKLKAGGDAIYDMEKVEFYGRREQIRLGKKFNAE